MLQTRCDLFCDSWCFEGLKEAADFHKLSIRPAPSGGFLAPPAAMSFPEECEENAEAIGADREEANRQLQEALPYLHEARS